MRSDVDVLFIGGPLREVSMPIEKLLNPASGALRPPASIPVGNLQPAPMFGLTFIDFDEITGEALRTQVPMVGSPPVVGQYTPQGITDNGRRAYVWCEHGEHG